MRILLHDDVRAMGLNIRKRMNGDRIWQIDGMILEESNKQSFRESGLLLLNPCRNHNLQGVEIERLRQ